MAIVAVMSTLKLTSTRRSSASMDNSCSDPPVEFADKSSATLYTRNPQYDAYMFNDGFPALKYELYISNPLMRLSRCLPLPT